MKITAAILSITTFVGAAKCSLALDRALLDQATNGATQHNWWEFGLGDPIADEVALFYLGHTYFQGADIGEVLETIYRTNHTDPRSWHDEFTKTAERLEAVGKEFEDEGHDLTAGQSFLRAATYRRASLHRHPDPFHEEVPIVTQQAVDNFEKFLALTSYPCKAVQIPYEDTTLPGYLCINRNAANPAPLIIYNQGKDGWMEDGKNVVDEAMQRGYHVLLYDGPGMGRTIRLQGLPFRHDWEKVVSAVIDFAIDQPQVDGDNLALISLSLGGFLAPRAACFEHRLKALVPNPGVVSWHRVYESELQLLASAFGFGPEIFELLEDDPAAFDEEVLKMMSTSDFLHWGFVDSMWHHGVDSPSTLMNELKKFDIVDLMGNITTATLVVDADAETRAQAWELYEGLTGAVKKDYLKFSADEAAQFHDQPGAMGIQSARIFNWLDEILETRAVLEDESTVSKLAASAAPRGICSIGGAVVLVTLVLSWTL
ncbi:20-hydroxy-prefusarin hydrolase FUS2 [Seminavis robusta]|uniref:20-hydroxy-prefusarin hydrolase FUS2 n=1 Tax=Seminavis robusta TaxID=568900 RepID=A0A9N8ERZ7_9STRA|nr:20-hydroxy-prefusarin hydrolase FUS2 [Seminavis robusta]|eukprot:Sro1614_g286130.1 20-hydroxy-prefusarin hydrolase FUS2 (485) ;mRNA; f:20247-22130